MISFLKDFRRIKSFKENGLKSEIQWKLENSWNQTRNASIAPYIGGRQLKIL